MNLERYHISLSFYNHAVKSPFNTFSVTGMIFTSAQISHHEETFNLLSLPVNQIACCIILKELIFLSLP